MFDRSVVFVVGGGRGVDHKKGSSGGVGRSSNRLLFLVGVLRSVCLEVRTSVVFWQQVGEEESLEEEERSFEFVAYYSYLPLPACVWL